MAKFSRRWVASALLATVIGLSILLRVVGSRFGFPLLLHPDEWAVVDAVIDMAKRNSFEPPWSLRPDHVEMKVDYILFAGYAVGLRHMSIEAAFAQDPVTFYWIARLATAAFGVAAVIVAYLIGRRSSRAQGLLMAGLFAVFAPFVVNAHYATPDVPLTFALLLMAYALMRYTDSASRASLLWASFAVALGTAIKYPAVAGCAVIGLMVVVVALRDRAWLRIVTHGLLAIGGFLGFLFLISPTLFTNFSGVRKELKIQAAGDRLGHPDLGFTGNVWYYVETFARSGGLLVVALAAIGLVVVVRQRRIDTIPWIIGPVVLISLSTLPMTWERWGLPMWITPLLLSAVGLDMLWRRCRSSRTAWIPWLIGIIVGLNLGLGAVRADAALVAPDTRSAALAFANAHGMDPTNTTSEGYTPFLPGTSGLFFKNRVKPSGTGGYDFEASKGGAPARYVILSSGMYNRVFADPTQKEYQAIYRWIFDNATLVQQFDPMSFPPASVFEPVSIARSLRTIKEVVDGGMSGPTIKIYELPKD